MKRADFIKKYSAKIYIGDGVYVHFDGFHFILSLDESSKRYDCWIGLEPAVFDALIAYRKEVYAAIERLFD